MGLARGMKRPVEIFYKRLASPVRSGHGFGTLAYKSGPFSGFGEDKSGSYRIYGDVRSSLMFPKRLYSGGASSPEQISLIKQLRERTSAPIKDVKAALSDCDWDIEAAQKELRKRGVVLASKKSSRTAAEGLLALARNEEKAAVIELNCETDFVARNEIFQYLALSLAKLALLVEGSLHFSGAIPLGPDLLEGRNLMFDHPKLHGEKSVQNAITEVSAMMGENVKLRRGFSLSAPSHGILSSYVHASPQPGIGRIAGFLSLEVEDQSASLDALKQVGPELASHIVASKPLFLTKELVSSNALDTEREILKSQAESTGKPQSTIEKMVEGRLRKYYEEVVLMEQKFFFNDSINVKTLLDNLSKEVGSPVKIADFLRMEVGGLQRLKHRRCFLQFDLKAWKADNHMKKFQEALENLRNINRVDNRHQNVRNLTDMAQDNGNRRVGWMDNMEVVKTFLEVCNQELSLHGRSRGSSLKKESWEKVKTVVETTHNIVVTQKEMKNFYDELRKKYIVWSDITKKRGNAYDPLTNTIQMSNSEWDEYMKTHKHAYKLRNAPLPFPDLCKTLFDGAVATGDHGWSPSSAMPRPGASSVSTATEANGFDITEDDSQNYEAINSPPQSSIPIEGNRGKKRKLSSLEKEVDDKMSVALDLYIRKNTAPSVDECMDKLNELGWQGELYNAAVFLFCENDSYKKVWMKMEDVNKLESWVQAMGKRMGTI